MNHHHHIINIIGEINEERVKEFFSYPIGESTISEKEIHIQIYSWGGEGLAARAIIAKIEEFKAKGWKIVTYAYGDCSSCAFYIFLTGDERWIHRDCRVIIHTWTFSDTNMSIEEIRQAAEFYEGTHTRFIEKYCPKIKHLLKEPNCYLTSGDILKYEIAKIMG